MNELYKKIKEIENDWDEIPALGLMYEAGFIKGCQLIGLGGEVIKGNGERELITPSKVKQLWELFKEWLKTRSDY